MFTKSKILLFLLFVTTGSTFADLDIQEAIDALNVERNAQLENNDEPKEPTPKIQVLQIDETSEAEGRWHLMYENVVTSKQYIYPRQLLGVSMTQICSLVFPPVKTCSSHAVYKVTSKDGKITEYYIQPTEKSGNQTVVRTGISFALRDKNEAAMKHVVAKISKLVDGVHMPWETEVYQKLMPCDGIPKLITHGTMLSQYGEGNGEVPKYALILEGMSDDLESLKSICDGTFSMDTIMQLMQQVLPTLKHIHSNHLVHGDIQPTNLMIPIVQKGVRGQPSFKIIDFDKAKPYTLGNTNASLNINDIEIGTIRTMSTFAHNGFHPHPRDDLQSLLFTIIWLIKGSLPWENECLIAIFWFTQYEELRERNTIRENLRESMDDLCQKKEAYLQEFVEDNEPFKELVDYISAMNPNVFPNYDFLQWQVQRIFLNLTLTSSVLDWVEVPQMVFGSRDVISATIKFAQTADYTYKFEYYVKTFYTNLALEFYGIQEDVVPLYELFPLALDLLKQASVENLEDVFVSKDILLADVHKISLEDFVEPDLIREHLQSNIYVGFGYTYNSTQDTIKIGVVLRDLKSLWGTVAIKNAVRKEAELVQYPRLTFREEYGNSAYDVRKAFDVPIDPKCPLGAVFVGLNKFREFFSMSLTRGEFKEVTYAYQCISSDDPNVVPNLTFTFKLLCQTDFRFFLDRICFGLKETTVELWTWSVDHHTPWPTDFPTTDPSTGEERVRVKKVGDVLVILGSECVSLNPTNGESLPALETEGVTEFILECKVPPNVRMWWRTNTSGKYDYMFVRDTFHRDVIPNNVTNTVTSKFCRAEARQWANEEAERMVSKPNPVVSIQKEDGYILLVKTRILDSFTTVEKNIRLTVSDLKESISRLSVKQHSEIVAFAYGYTVKGDGTVNAVVIGQLYFYPILKNLRTIPQNENVQGPIILQQKLRLEAQAALQQSLLNPVGTLKANPDVVFARNPDVIFSNVLSYDQFCNLVLANFPTLVEYLKKVQLLQVGFDVIFVDGKISIAIAFRNVSADVWNRCNHFMITPFILAEYRKFTQKVQLDSIEINQTEIIGDIRKVFPVTVTAYRLDYDERTVADVVAGVFKELNDAKIQNLTKEGSVELCCFYKRSSDDTTMIEFGLLFVVRKVDATPAEKLFDELGTRPEFNGVAFSADSRQIRSDDPTLMDSRVFYIETSTEVWSDAVRVAVEVIQENRLIKRNDEHIRVGTTRNVDDNSYVVWLFFDSYYKEIGTGVGGNVPQSSFTVRRIANKVAMKMQPLNNLSISLLRWELGAFGFQTTIPVTQGKCVDDRIMQALTVLSEPENLSRLEPALPYILSQTFGYAVKPDGSVNAILFYETDFLEVLLLINDIRDKENRAPAVILHSNCFQRTKGLLFEQEGVEKSVEFFAVVSCTELEKTQDVYLKYIRGLPKDSGAYDALLRHNIRRVMLSTCDSTTNSRKVILKLFAYGDIYPNV